MDWRHNRPFRIALLVFVTAIALVWTAPYFVSLDLIRSGLSASIARKTGRILAIRGDARLVVLPRPALLLDNVSLTEPNKPDIFASTDRARESRLRTVAARLPRMVATSSWVKPSQ